MRFVTAALGIVLALFAVLQIGQPNGPLWLAVFGAGAFLALITLRRNMPLMLVRLLAVLSSLAMFCFFAGFFRLAPHLRPDWYERAAALDAIGLLFAGFAMIIVLSEYSCRMKCGTAEAHADDSHRSRQPDGHYFPPPSTQRRSTTPHTPHQHLL